MYPRCIFNGTGFCIEVCLDVTIALGSWFVLGAGPCIASALGELPGPLVQGGKPVCTGRSEREEAEKTRAQTDEEILMLQSTRGSIFIHIMQSVGNSSLIQQEILSYAIMKCY